MEDLNELTVEQSTIPINKEEGAINAQVATAHAYPRDIKRSLNNAIATATMDEETAQTCNYSLPRGGKTISGPSVHLAKIIAQTWGNMRVEASISSIDSGTITSQAVAFDLENNLAIKIEVKRSIMTKKGRMNDDMITVTGNAANAIAMRNAILSVVPKSIVDKVYNAAKALITGDISDEAKMIKRRDDVFSMFSDKLSVTEQELLTLMGKPKKDNIDKDDLVTLIGVAQAIKDGDTTVEQTFRPKRNKPSQKDEESERVSSFIEKAETLDDLEMLKDNLTPETELAWKAKWIKLGGE